MVSKKSLISVGCFTTNVEAIGVEDYHLWLKLAKKKIYKFAFIEEVLGVIAYMTIIKVAMYLERNEVGKMGPEKLLY